jgi:hypothetical protein
MGFLLDSGESEDEFSVHLPVTKSQKSGIKHMKTKHNITMLAVGLGLFTLIGCSKEQPAADTQSQASKAAEAVKAEANKATEAVKTGADKAADAVKNEANKAADSAKSAAKDVSDKVSK